MGAQIFSRNPDGSRGAELVVNPPPAPWEIPLPAQEPSAIPVVTMWTLCRHAAAGNPLARRVLRNLAGTR